MRSSRSQHFGTPTLATNYHPEIMPPRKREMQKTPPSPDLDDQRFPSGVKAVGRGEEHKSKSKLSRESRGLACIILPGFNQGRNEYFFLRCLNLPLPKPPDL